MKHVELFSQNLVSDAIITLCSYLVHTKRVQLMYLHKDWLNVKQRELSQEIIR